MNDREWEEYIQQFCYDKGKNCRIGEHLLEKHVPTYKLMEHVQKISRRNSNGNNKYAIMASITPEE